MLISRLSHNRVLRELGLRGLYKGSSITMMRDIPYFMIFFPLNHALVDWFTPKNGTCPLSGLLLAGCGAGMTSAFLSTYGDGGGLNPSHSHSSDADGCAENARAGS